MNDYPSDDSFPFADLSMDFNPMRCLAAICLFAFVSPAIGAEMPQLRHCVFFEFNDSSSDSDVAGVVKSFNELPSKIDAIADYERGTAINKSSNSAGLTHAFLLGFDTDEDRAAYLPDPAHKAFGKALGPHLKQVFVIDFWGTKCPIKSKHVKHCVFLKFKPDADAAAVDDVVNTFLALGESIDTVRHLDGGENNSPENHDAGFTHGFVVCFDNADDLAAYGPHPAHQALVDKLKPVMADVRVVDFYTEAK